MTIQELVEARAPFDLNRPAVREFGGRNLKDVWREADRGTWLAWCASRSGVKPEKLVAALCEAAGWMLKQIPSSPDLKPALLAPAQKWSRSGEGRTEAIGAGWALADQADQVVRAGSDPVKAAALWALADVLLTVRNPLRAPQALSGCAGAVAAGGGDEEAAEKSLADLLRRNISWEDVEAGLATPAVQPSDRQEEEEERTNLLLERTMQSVDGLLKQAAELQYQFDNNLQEVGLSRKAVGRVMGDSFLNEVERRVVQNTVTEMDRTEAPKPRGSGKRPRLTI